MIIVRQAASLRIAFTPFKAHYNKYLAHALKGSKFIKYHGFRDGGLNSYQSTCCIITRTVHPCLDIVCNKVIIIIGLVSWVQRCHRFSLILVTMHQAPGASGGVLYYPGLVSCPFYAIPICPL